MPPKKAGTFAHYEAQAPHREDEDEQTQNGFVPRPSDGPFAREILEPSTRRVLELERETDRGSTDRDAVYEDETATSRRPMDPYEKWLSERHSEEPKTRKKAEKPAISEDAKTLHKSENKRAAVLGVDSRDSSPSLEIEIVDAPHDLSLSAPWEVPMAEELEPQSVRTSDVIEQVEQVESKDDQTRAGMPRAPYAHASGFVPRTPAQVYAQPIPHPPLVPRVATPFASFPPGYMQAVQPAPKTIAFPQPGVHPPPQYVSPVPAPLQQIASSVPPVMGMMSGMPGTIGMQQMPGVLPPSYSPVSPSYPAPAQNAYPSTRPHSPWGPTVPPSRPLLPQVTTQNSTADGSRQVHRAPWFCLGLAVGVASMVVAFFLPTSHGDSSASVSAASTSPLPTMQIPTARVAAATSPSSATQMPAQLGTPVSPAAPSQNAVAQNAAQNMAPSSAKPVPTVDVKSLPVASAKQVAPPPAPVARRAAVRAPVVRAQPRRAAPPKPIQQDDDDAFASSAPAAPAPAAKPAQESNSLAGDVLLQAL